MLMRVRMHNLGVGVSGRKFIGDPLRDPGKVEHTQQDEHQTHRKFHRQPDLYWNCQVENDDARSDDENRQGVAKSPECANHAGMAHASLTAHDRGDRNHVVGVSRVPHPEKKSEADNSEQVGQSGHGENRVGAVRKPIAPPVYL